MTGYDTFLVPYDFSEHSREALHTALDLAERLEADVHVLHVLQVLGHLYGHGGPAAAAAPLAVDLTEVRAGVLAALRDVAAESARPSVTPTPQVVDGVSVAEVIVDVATDLGADLIVMGTHGRTGLAHVFLGSVAERTLRRATCPVMTVRAADDQEAESVPVVQAGPSQEARRVRRSA